MVSQSKDCSHIALEQCLDGVLAGRSICIGNNEGKIEGDIISFEYQKRHQIVRVVVLTILDIWGRVKSLANKYGSLFDNKVGLDVAITPHAFQKARIGL
jgi:hypothetical protein